MKALRRLKNLVEKNSLARLVFDYFFSLPAYRPFLKIKIKRYIKKIKKSKRYNIILETTNICNARCLMCPHSKMKRKKEAMTDSVFELIIKRLKKEKISPLCFIVNGFGEPFTDKKIIKRIKTLKDNFPQAAIKIYTNLSLLASAKKIEEFVFSGINEVNISFNGYSPKNYRKIMGLDYKRTKKNLEALIRTRNRLNPDLKIRMSMALAADNQKKINRFINYWEDKVDSVSVNRIHTYGGSVPDYSGNLKIDYGKKPVACKYLWSTIVFGVKGDTFLCCLDYEGQYNFGNIEKREILDIFYSPKFEAIRKMHLKGDLAKMKICQKCYTPYRNGIEWLIEKLF